MCYKVHREANQQFYIQCSSTGSGYTIQSVRTRWYVRVEGKELRDSCPHNKTVWDLDQQFGDVYTISILGTKSRMWHPNRPENKDNLIYLTERDASDGCLWRFEKVSDDAGDPPDSPQPVSVPVSLPPSFLSKPNVDMSQNSISPYVDNPHFYTDMLFNMPRTPFTRTQRLAALEWARWLGAPNVPTIESFDECERILEAGRKDENNLGRHAE